MFITKSSSSCVWCIFYHFGISRKNANGGNDNVNSTKRKRNCQNIPVIKYFVLSNRKHQPNFPCSFWFLSATTTTKTVKPEFCGFVFTVFSNKLNFRFCSNWNEDRKNVRVYFRVFVCAVRWHSIKGEMKLKKNTYIFVCVYFGKRCNRCRFFCYEVFKKNLSYFESSMPKIYSTFVLLCARRA